MSATESNSYMERTMRQIEEIDSKGDKWDKAHYLGVARICGCKGCYCCAVQQWAWQKIKQGAKHEQD